MNRSRECKESGPLGIAGLVFYRPAPITVAVRLSPTALSGAEGRL